MEPGLGEWFGSGRKLFASVMENCCCGTWTSPEAKTDVAPALDVQKNQARGWLTRLVADGAIEKLSKPPFDIEPLTPRIPGPLLPTSGGVLMPAEELSLSARELLLAYLRRAQNRGRRRGRFDIRKQSGA